MKFIPRVFRLTSLVLSAALVGCSTEKAADDDRGTKVLMIGNSFSICLLHHLPQVAADRGVELDLASLYIGGCTLKRHWSNVLSNEVDQAFRPYKFGRNRFGKYTETKMNVCDALRLAKWDIVTIQQGSHESWKPKSYHPYGDDLVAKIRELAPQAQIVVQETWSYTPWDKRLAQWGIDQDQMYAKLHGAYADFAKQHGLGVIPFGTAVQEWRRRLPVKYTEKSFGGDVVGGAWQDPRDQFKRGADNKWVPNSDVFHLNNRGEYFQALVWVRALFGVDLNGLGYRPPFVTEDDAKLMREIAQKVEEVR